MAAIIFDFDGTLADSRDYVINFIVKSKHKPPLTDSERVALYGLSMIAIARHLGYSWWRLPGLYLSGRRRMDKAINNINTFRGMVEVIRKLHAQGHQLFIVSSNSVGNIRRFLKKHHLQRYFMQVYGGIEVFGKAGIYRQLLKDHNLDAEQTLCIGDELRDLEAAQAVNLKAIGVTWGFARTEDLTALNPIGLAHSPSDLVRIIDEL